MKKTLVRSIINNKVFLYMGSRYITYALQFITSLFIAFKLGPDKFGIWSFILLVVSFFNVIDFGISNSLNVLLVQDKENSFKRDIHISSSIVLTSGLCIFVLICYVTAYFCDWEIVAKYGVNKYLPIISFVIIVAYFNKILCAVFRVDNKLLEIAVNQSLEPILIFVAVVVIPGTTIGLLVLSLTLGYLGSLLFFVFRFSNKFHFIFSKQGLFVVAQKGFWLFLYNSAFYLIMYTTSLMVSANYPVESFGKYNFSYTLAHAIIKLIDAFGFVVFPKMIFILKSSEYQKCRKAIESIRLNYQLMIYGMVFLALPAFYFLCKLAPQYSDANRALYISALSLLPYANAFGLNTFLIAQNKERILSFVSIGCLFFNLLLVFSLTHLLHIQFDLVLLAVMGTYVIFTFFCAFLTNIHLNSNNNIISAIGLAFPVKVAIPLLLSIPLVFLSNEYDSWSVLFLPVLFFVVMNLRDIKSVFNFAKKIIDNPNIIDIR